MKQNDFFLSQEFLRLHPLKQQIIKELVNNSQSSSVESMIPNIISINKELKKRNLSFSKSESKLLIKILTKDMTDTDRSKINMIMSMM